MGRYGQTSTIERNPNRGATKPPARLAGKPSASSGQTAKVASVQPRMPEREAAEKASSRPSIFGKRKIGRVEAAQIATQLGIMVDAGVPLSQALEGMQSQSDQPHVQQALQSILSDVRNGSDLSVAIARCPYQFPSVLSKLLRAAEASGALGTMLNRAASYLQAEVDTVRQLRGAMAYPTIMLMLGVGALGLIFGFVLPRFEVMYQGHEAMLPVPTKIALGISHGLRQHWMALTGLTAAAIVGVIVYLRSSSGRLTTDWLKLHIPLVNRMFRQFYVARSFQTMGTMISAGVTLPEAVKLSRDVAGNVYFSRLWDVAEVGLQNGQRLADPLFASDLISNSVAQMVATGERSGNLANVMQRVAGLCEIELQHTIKTVSGMLEPIMIIALGGIVGSVVMAILLPIFRMSKMMGG